MSLHVFILGMLMEEEHHPYELKKMLKDKNIDKLVNIVDGTLYYAFDVLTKKGYIRPVESVHEEKRPNKTRYAITDAGKKALEDEIYEQFRVDFDVKALYSAVFFMRYANARKIAFLLEDKIKRLRAKLEKQQEMLSSASNEKEAGVQFIIQHAYSHQQVELEWLQKLSDYINAQAQEQR